MNDTKEIVEKKYSTRLNLFLCIFLDGLGMLSYLFPVVGEGVDFVWAPISAIVHARMLKGQAGFVAGAFTLLEEGLPGSDFIPSFTIIWLWKYYSRR